MVAGFPVYKVDSGAMLCNFLTFLCMLLLEKIGGVTKYYCKWQFDFCGLHSEKWRLHRKLRSQVNILIFFAYRH